MDGLVQAGVPEHPPPPPPPREITLGSHRESARETHNGGGRRCKKGGKIYATMSKTRDDTLQKWNLKMGGCDFSDNVREHCAAATKLSVL